MHKMILCIYILYFTAMGNGGIHYIYLYKNIQDEYKFFPWLQTFITRKQLYVEYKQIIYVFEM